MVTNYKRSFKDSKIILKRTFTILVSSVINCVIQLRTNSILVLLCYYLLLIPDVLCKTELPKHLTYDKIFNHTEFAQIKYTHRPHKDGIKQNQSEDATKENEISYDEYEYMSNGKLLVGFARDPYRYSIPEDDYLKGVRYLEPPLNSYKGDNRGKRGVFHLYNMLTCATGCDPLSYKGYGCYCGFLGAGRPTDGIDNCCRMHDECYENIYCPFYTVYFQPYYWKCYHGEPLCALENWQTEHQFINGCAGRLCECDRLFAMCVRRYRCPRRRALCRSSPIRLLQNLLMFR